MSKNDQHNNTATGIAQTIAEELLGALPVPGLDTVVGIFFSWLTPKTPTWDDLVAEIEKMIMEAVDESELNAINNAIRDAEELYDVFSKDLEAAGWQPGEVPNPEFSSRLIDIETELAEAQNTLYHSNAASYKTISYFQRYFVLHCAVLTSCVQYLDTYDPSNHFVSLFTETDDYLRRSMESAITIRQGEIAHKSGGANLWYEYDCRKEKDITDWWAPTGNEHKQVIDERAYYLRSKAAATMIAHLQYKKAILNYDKIVTRYNREMGASIPLLESHWESTISELVNHVRSQWNLIKDLGYADPDKNPGIRFDLFPYNGPDSIDPYQQLDPDWWNALCPS